MAKPPNAPPSPRERRMTLVQELAKRARLDSWNSFVEELKLPTALAIPLATNRPSLMRLARPTALTEAECGQLYTLIAALMETNQALREHAEELAKLADITQQSMTGLQSTLTQIQLFAHFKHGQIGPAGEDSDG